VRRRHELKAQNIAEQGSGSCRESKTTPAKRAHTVGKGNDGASGRYVQVFLYGVPKANHDSFAATEEKLFATFRRHGILGSDLYECGDARMFKGFRDLRAVLEASRMRKCGWRSTGTATRPTAFG
jgi:hypothetical protein